MAKVKVSNSSKSLLEIRPALTPEGRENQMVSLAVNLAEQQLRDGTASSQVITHFLKLGTETAKLERERLKGEIELQKAKAEALRSQKEIDKLYKNAINAMKKYSGYGDPDDED